MALWLTGGIVLFLIVLLYAVIKNRIWEDESRIVNSHSLDSTVKFHLISRWGIQH